METSFNPPFTKGISNMEKNMEKEPIIMDPIIITMEIGLTTSKKGTECISIMEIFTMDFGFVTKDMEMEV
jgi:hypothetical protein